MMRIHVGMQTPWGAADGVEVLDADGHIVWVNTPGHGGVYVSKEARAAMPAPLRDLGTWAGEAADGGAWYEEDCDWAIVALAWPELPFWEQGQDSLNYARAMVARQHPEAFVRWEAGCCEECGRYSCHQSTHTHEASQ